MSWVFSGGGKRGKAEAVVNSGADGAPQGTGRGQIYWGVTGYLGLCLKLFEFMPL